MKKLLAPILLVFTFSQNAQSPTAVPIPKEPHHRLVLENEYVRVFRVSVPAHESTLLHQHDVPYLYVSLGPADVINAVQNKPEVHLVMADGQLGYSPGRFAHIARNLSDSAFNNVTIELLHPQGSTHNRCASVILNEPPTLLCHYPQAEARVANSSTLFDTDELVAERHSLGPKVVAPNSKSRRDRLLIFESDSPLRVERPDKPVVTPKAGEVLWVDAESKVKITNPDQATGSSYLVLSIKHSDNPKKP
jgi:hypothetical protein